jgi:hypothetical protein
MQVAEVVPRHRGRCVAIRGWQRWWCRTVVVVTSRWWPYAVGRLGACGTVVVVWPYTGGGGGAARSSSSRRRGHTRVAEMVVVVVVGGWSVVVVVGEYLPQSPL